MQGIERWTGYQTSVFTRMTQRAIERGAVNLAQGFPDFDGPDILKDEAIAAIRSGGNQYAPSPGVARLRQLLAARRLTLGGPRYDADSEVTVFSGATEALFCAIMVLLNPGDEILAFEPSYDSYAAAAMAAGARLVGVPLQGRGFAVDVDALARAITPKSKVLLLNAPHNPSGRVFDKDELEAIAALVKRHQLFLITDEVYEELVYPPHQHRSAATLAGMRERCILISSTAKTYSMTGWKVGYAFAPAPITAAMRALHQFTVFCSATPLQLAMCAALSLPESYYLELRRDYQTKRDLLSAALKAKGFIVNPVAGTYFVLADYSPLSQDEDTYFADWMTDQVGIAAIPLSPFFQDQERARRTQRWLRFAFCKKDSTLALALKRLNEWQTPSVAP